MRPYDASAAVASAAERRASVLEQTPAAVRQTHARALAKLGGRATRLGI